MTRDQKIIRTKVGLLELAKQLGNVSQACKIMGYSRDSFYRFQELYEKGGEAALMDLSRRVPNIKNLTAPEIEEKVVAIAVEQAAWGQRRVANELAKRGVSISPAGVRAVAAVMMVGPVLSLGWVWLQWRGHNNGTLHLVGRRAAKYVAHDLADYRGELVLLIMAAVIGALGATL